MRCRAASTVGTPSTRRRLPDGERALCRPAQVLGQDMQVLRIHLNRGDKALAEPGAMVYMSENVEAGCDSAKWWPRCMGCEPCCFATFEAKGDGAYVGLTPNRPAKVLPLVLGGRRFLGKKGMYFASTGHVDVDFNMDLNPVTCCCGGQGMIRQVLKGDGIAFIGAMGVLTHKVLAPGEKLIVDTNSVVAWEETVEYGVKKNSGGLCMCCCGGEGFFSTQLTGPGEVYVQSYSHAKFKQYAVDWYLGAHPVTRRGGAAFGGAAPAAEMDRS